MSERYPVGTRVQVKNDDLGSQFRSESERVGEFTGTVVAVNGPDYTGIPEVCVESETGERRVILVGDLEEAPAALETPETTEVTGPHCGETDMDGAIEYIPGDSFRVGDVVAYPCRIPATVVRAAEDGEDVFGRPLKRLYCRAIDGSREGFVNYGPRGKLPRLKSPEPVTEYSVKIWYRSGAYEGAPQCPEDLARKIFADAVASDGVEFAELHGPSGKLVESKTRTEESTMATEPDPQTPDENLFLTGLPLIHGDPLPPAPELPQEPAEPTA